MLLTEKELKYIVEESVHILLNELDWKTYHSAANKEKDKVRSDKFGKARDKTFNDKFGYNDDGKEIKMGFPSATYNKDAILRMDVENPKDYERFTKNNNNEYYSHNVNPKDGYNRSSGHSELPSTDDNKMARKMDKAHNEFETLKNTKYVRGQGYKNLDNASIESSNGQPNTQGVKNQGWHKFLKKNN